MNDNPSTGVIRISFFQSVILFETLVSKNIAIQPGRCDCSSRKVNDCSCGSLTIGGQDDIIKIPP